MRRKLRRMPTEAKDVVAWLEKKRENCLPFRHWHQLRGKYHQRNLHQLALWCGISIWKRKIKFCKKRTFRCKTNKIKGKLPTGHFGSPGTRRALLRSCHPSITIIANIIPATYRYRRLHLCFLSQSMVVVCDVPRMGCLCVRSKAIGTRKWLWVWRGLRCCFVPSVAENETSALAVSSSGFLVRTVN